MIVLVKCWTPEWYDEVTHALIEVTPELVRDIFQKMVIAQGHHLQDNSFLRLEWFDYSPEFIDFYEPEKLGLTEEQLEEEWIEVCERFSSDSLTTRTMMPVTLRVGLEDFHWKAHAKHGGHNAWAETYTLTRKDLEQWAEELGVKLDG